MFLTFEWVWWFMLNQTVDQFRKYSNSNETLDCCFSNLLLVCIHIKPLTLRMKVWSLISLNQIQMQFWPFSLPLSNTYVSNSKRKIKPKLLALRMFHFHGGQVVGWYWLNDYEWVWKRTDGSRIIMLLCIGYVRPSFEANTE